MDLVHLKNVVMNKLEQKEINVKCKMEMEMEMEM